MFYFRISLQVIFLLSLRVYCKGRGRASRRTPCMISRVSARGGAGGPLAPGTLAAGRRGSGACGLSDAITAEPLRSAPCRGPWRGRGDSLGGAWSDRLPSGPPWCRPGPSGQQGFLSAAQAEPRAWGRPTSFTLGQQTCHSMLPSPRHLHGLVTVATSPCGLNSMPRTAGQILDHLRHLRLPSGWTESTFTTWRNIFLICDAFL